MKQTILIVDDNEHLREILAVILRYSGYEIIDVGTGSQAIQQAAAVKPNLILLDLDLPDITGIDLAKRLKASPGTAHIPIVACSAANGWEWRDAALVAGIAEYLQKPIPLPLIKKTISKHILASA